MTPKRCQSKLDNRDFAL